MAKNDQNALKFKNWILFSQKIPISNTVHSVIMYTHGFGQKTASGCNWGLARNPNSQKMPENDLFQATPKSMKNDEIFSAKP